MTAQSVVAIQTPLGSLLLRAMVGSNIVRLSEPEHLPGGDFTSTPFTLPEATGKLLLGKVDPGLLDDQHVDDCWGVIWRVQAEIDLPEHVTLEFSCSWGSDSVWAETGWGSGQTVISQSWERRLTQIAIGTVEPTFALRSYAEQQHFHLPLRWFKDCPEFFEFDCVEASSAGLTVRYPALRAGELCHAQFAIAWKERRDMDDQDAVLAVDLAPGQIFRAAFGWNSDNGHSDLN